MCVCVCVCVCVCDVCDDARTANMSHSKLLVSAPLGWMMFTSNVMSSSISTGAYSSITTRETPEVDDTHASAAFGAVV